MGAKAMPPKRESRLNDEEEDQTMNAFWSESWKKVDPKRISEFGNAIDDSPDEVIALIRQHHAKTVCDAGCGCGIYCTRLINHGFSVSGFEVRAKLESMHSTPYFWQKTIS